MRILIWLQFHLTSVNLVVAVVAGAILSGSTSGRSYASASGASGDQLGRLEMLMPARKGTAVLLGLTAALVRRGFLVAFPLVLAAEAVVLVDLGLAARAGIVVGIVAALLVVLGGWILADLFRREVRAFLLRSSASRRYSGPVGAG
ncbi:hypothetical protein ONA70_35750 [Micromonospora yasonensis]|uniref:hypothetical protein n=1 Tax=Micromonospora yasonensis TaxID=1128667 RepID=UPI002232B621|nr:hypothetical protein [Micromonospora yasonensis]MCW3845431.1 hypothetical protein [Micromonospora yasonensis]